MSVTLQDVLAEKTCTKCGARKPLSAFQRRSNRPGRSSRCKSCLSESMREWEKRNPRRYIGARRDQVRAAGHRFKQKRKEKVERGLCAYCSQQRERLDIKLCDTCHSASLAAGIRNRQRLKLQMIAAYGGCCACCGEAEPDFLTLDHVNDDGAVERRDSSGRSVLIMARLRREGWPKGQYQILCFNCNCARAAFGTCPHQRKARHDVA